MKSSQVSMKANIVFSIFVLIASILIVGVLWCYSSWFAPPMSVQKDTRQQIDRLYQSLHFNGERSAVHFAYGGVDRVPLLKYTYEETINGEPIEIQISDQGIAGWDSNDEVIYSVPDDTGLDVYNSSYITPIINYAFEHSTSWDPLTAQLEQALANKLGKVDDIELVISNKKQANSIKKITAKNRKNGQRNLGGFYQLDVQKLVETATLEPRIKIQWLKNMKSINDVRTFLSHQNLNLPDNTYNIYDQYALSCDIQVKNHKVITVQEHDNLTP